LHNARTLNDLKNDITNLCKIISSIFTFNEKKMLILKQEEGESGLTKCHLINSFLNIQIRKSKEKIDVSNENEQVLKSIVFDSNIFDFVNNKISKRDNEKCGKPGKVSASDSVSKIIQLVIGCMRFKDLVTDPILEEEQEPDISLCDNENCSENGDDLQEIKKFERKDDKAAHIIESTANLETWKTDLISEVRNLKSENREIISEVRELKSKVRKLKSKVRKLNRT